MEELADQADARDDDEWEGLIVHEEDDELGRIDLPSCSKAIRNSRFATSEAVLLGIEHQILYWERI